MPKRPCALTFTPDETTIICGDKFGDVYALPLFPVETARETPLQLHNTGVVEGDHPAAVERSRPSASLKTVHTLRNQKALQHQKNLTNQKPRKTVVASEHQLLLGHVSLLTDLACVSIPGGDTAGPQDRTYILTADRDEHIRVSRGMPQAHVIEGFCLGHTQFVSQLCVPGWNSELLISGGGDDFLLVWDWMTGRVLHKVELRGIIIDLVKRTSSEGFNDLQSEADETASEWKKSIAVSKILAVELKTATGMVRRHIIVVCEAYGTTKPLLSSC